MTYTVTAGEAQTSDILQRVSDLISTFQGEAPLYRDYGLPGNFVDKPLPVAKAILVSEVMEALAKYIPEVDAVSVSFRESDTIGRLIPCVEVTINEQFT